MRSMYLLKINLANVSGERGGPLSVDRHLGYPYYEMNLLSLLIMVSAVFVVSVKMKGYLLNTLATNKYSLLLNWKKAVARFCHGPLGTSCRSRDWMGCVALYCMQILHHLAYSAMSASMPGQYIVVLDFVLPFSIHWWASWRSSRGYAYSVSLD